MKTANPWPRCAVQITNPEDKVIGIQSGRTLEISETEVLIRPCKSSGRGGNYTILAQGYIWSQEFGVMDIADHKKKRDLIAQEEQLRKDVEEAASRKAKEARERGEAAQKRLVKPVKVVSDKPAKAIEEKPAKAIEEKMSMGKELKL